MKGIVLNRVPFKESSYIIYVLTNEGVKNIMVKGAKRINSHKLGICEPLSLIDFNLSKGKFPTLTDGYVVNDYKDIKADLELYSIASIILEYAYVIKEQDLNFNEIFDYVNESLDNLKNENEVSLFKFEFALLKTLGLSPNEEYIKDNYEYYNELKCSLLNLFNNEKIENKKILRKFISDYYSNELGINIKSKKIYNELM